MWEKRGGSRSHNYQSLFDPRAEKNRTCAIFFLQTSKTCQTFHWNLKYLHHGFKLQVVSPSYYHLSLIHGLLTLRGDSLSEANSMFVVICTDRRRTVFSDRFEKRNFNKNWYRTMISYHNLPNLKKLRDQPHQW